MPCAQILDEKAIMLLPDFFFEILEAGRLFPLLHVPPMEEIDVGVLAEVENANIMRPVSTQLSLQFRV